jgi:hypothetical protein
VRFVLLFLFSSVAYAESCPGLEKAKWAYDTENNILRLCIESDDGKRLNCTTFPKKVFMDNENPFRR